MIFGRNQLFGADICFRTLNADAHKIGLLEVLDMKTKKHLLSAVLKSTGFFLFLIILATCDVGLGPSVDTTAPSVSVDSPKASAVVSGEFTFGGIATDDGSIKSVEVTFQGLGTASGTNYTFQSNPEDTASRKVTVANKEWKLVVDSAGNTPIEDGTYQLIVTVTDDSGKATSQMTTFTVDNTAPVVIVTSPDEKSASKNYDIQIDGKIYDATDLQKITVSLYDADGNERMSEDAKMTGTGTWTVMFDGENMIFADTDDTLLTDGNYRYKIKASDAQGNTSTYFFHKADI